MSLAIDVHDLVKRYGTRTVVDRVSRDRAGPHLRLPRPQRLGQDHDTAHDLRAADARRRRRHLPRPRPGARARGDQAPGRLHDPALRPLRGSHHPREPRLRRPRLRPRSAEASASTSRSSGSGSRRARSSSPARCRAAGSSGWRWRPACCTSPSCCCSTSRPPASIPRRAAPSGTRSMPMPRRASPCWSRPTTWTRPSAVTRSPTSPMAS